MELAKWYISLYMYIYQHQHGWSQACEVCGESGPRIISIYSTCEIISHNHFLLPFFLIFIFYNVRGNYRKKEKKKEKAKMRQYISGMYG